MNELIFVVDDEPDILELVSLHLKKSGFKVAEFQDGKAFLSAIEHRVPDLVILDLMLPDADGLEVCKYLRKREEFSYLPIIMLTAKVEETDKVLGLELGADDYVTKPFSPRELIARVKAVLRRRERKGNGAQVKIGGILTLDMQKYQVGVEGRRVELTSTEFRILKLLSSKKGWVFTRDQILDYLWGDEKVVLDRTIDVHIKNIREKLGKAGKFIKNIRGVGYKLEDYRP